MTTTVTPPVPRLARGNRRSLAADPGRLAVFEPLLPGGPMPLLCRPALPGVSLPEWAAANRAKILALLLRHGAILFRGFGVAGLDEINLPAPRGGVLPASHHSVLRTAV